MHNTLKSFIPLMLTIFLCGCIHSGGKIDYKSRSVSEETDNYKINGEILSVCGDTEGITSLNGALESEFNDWKENFISRAEHISTPGSEIPCLQSRNEIKLCNKDLISIITEKYIYLNGLHGNIWWSAKTFDARKDNMLMLSDLFLDESYKDILEERMNELIEKDEKSYHDLWEKPTIDKNRQDKFYLDDKNLVIFYEPYELSYYARGMVEFPIPLEKIRGYIKSEYLTS